MHNYVPISTIVSILRECDVSRNNMSMYKQLQLYLRKQFHWLELKHFIMNLTKNTTKVFATCQEPEVLGTSFI